MVRKFPAPSLMCQIAELKRERASRVTLYERLIERGTITERVALFQMRCLDGAIETLEGLMS